MKERELTAFGKSLERNEEGNVTQFDLLPCPFCGSAAEMSIFSSGAADDLDHVFIRCTGHDCDASGPSCYVCDKEPAEHHMRRLQRNVDRWNRRQQSVQAPPALRAVPDDALLSEMKRRLSRATEQRPADAIGYVFPSRTPDGKHTFSLWGSQ